LDYSIGLIVGFVFCSILMSVVGSAVNTVIVCYAESPAEFEANHPQLSAEMRSAWIQAWPGLVN
jgi:large-conductance mechanosensitive channel